MKKSSHQTIDICIKAQAVNGAWVVDADLTRGSADRPTLDMRKRSWQIEAPIFCYDILAAALPGILLDLDRGAWKGRKIRSARKSPRKP